jgi:hypothetical protein
VLGVPTTLVVGRRGRELERAVPVRSAFLAVDVDGTCSSGVVLPTRGVLRTLLTDGEVLEQETAEAERNVAIPSAEWEISKTGMLPQEGGIQYMPTERGLRGRWRVWRCGGAHSRDQRDRLEGMPARRWSGSLFAGTATVVLLTRAGKKARFRDSSGLRWQSRAARSSDGSQQLA